ncbi:hypothetical protein FJZ33_00015 [Candidatus Poribacteria bacterium]|nr:hypothetical protein [Candidatus Poribacteria bacterium]
MENIKIIPTKYNGYFFRSRTEARWAVYFDECGIDYIYEYEGFELKNKQRYLPDFWFPQYKCFGEIKPIYPTNKEEEKIKQLVEMTGRPLIIFIGMPSVSPEIYECRKNKEKIYIYKSLFTIINNSIFYIHKDFINEYPQFQFIYDNMKEKIDFAKSARFEFGEAK